MSKIIFVTATDTGAGKTYVSAGLLRVAAARSLTAIGIKPVASGCHVHHGQLYNDDALRLQEAANCKLDYHSINPFAFAPAIAPHIAAHASARRLDCTQLIQHTQATLAIPADIHIVEGFGGWHAPLNERETMADYALQITNKMLLVVGLRVGCLNHAILTERAITASGAACIGWVANLIDPAMTHQRENIETLQNWLHSPLLATIQHGEPAASALHDTTIF